MKAVVVEIKGNVAAVLGEDGQVSKVKNKDYNLGQEVKLKSNNKYIKIAASVAAAMAIFVTPAWAYLTPYSYVSLDVNPSFEFSINRFDRVLDVKAINNNGEKIVEDLNLSKLKNKEIKEAVKNVIVKLKEQGYINGSEAGVVVAATSKSSEKTKELTSSLKTAVKEEVTREYEVKVEPVKQPTIEKELIKEEKKAEKRERQVVEEEKEIKKPKKPKKSEKEEIKEIKKFEKEKAKETKKSEKEKVKETKKSEKEKAKETKKSEKQENKSNENKNN